MIYAQQSIDMMSTTVTNYNNKMGVDEWVRRNSDSNSSSPSRRSNQSGTSSKTSFTPDPEITREVQESFISKANDARGKKFLTLLLTKKNADRIFGEFINPNDIADVFTVASLYSFALIEDKGALNKEQIRSTRQRFRKMFAESSTDRATMQRGSETLLYWTMLIAYSQLSAQKGDNTDAQALAGVKAKASDMMTQIGLSPQKYTLNDRGFVKK